MTLVSRIVFLQKKNTANKSSKKIKINEISIIIPVKDNQSGINNYLDNFFITHTVEKYPKEIIIVDNNSCIPIEIPGLYQNKGITIKLISCFKPGPASSRNLGVNAAKGQWILFNDSDCIPTPTLLTGYLQADNCSIAYAGNIKSLKQDLLSRYYESQEILIPLKTLNSHGEFVPQYLISANTLVWTESFKEIGGFNEDITIAGGEDIDFGLRLSQIGCLSYANQSIALHDFDIGIKDFCYRFFRYGKGNRIVQQLWNTDMTPKPFTPNERTVFNFFVAYFQYLFLFVGYKLLDIQLKYNLAKNFKEYA